MSRFSLSCAHRDLHSFPTRRSSDLREIGLRMALGASRANVLRLVAREGLAPAAAGAALGLVTAFWFGRTLSAWLSRSEEHTSELQSRLHLVCRLLLEKKKYNTLCVS